MSDRSNLMTAHIRKENNTEQTIREHCRNVSVLCEKYASCLTAEHIGALQGLLHDAGKMTNIFQDYLHDRIKKHRGEIDHSFSGAKYLCHLASCMDDRKYYSVSRLIAHTILSHHGIHDWVNSEFQDYFHERLMKNENYEEVCQNMNQIAEDAELLDLLKYAGNEYQELDTKIRNLCQKNKEFYAFYMGMLERFFQSVLIDADRTDTASFMTNSQTEKSFDTEMLWKKMSDKMQEKYLEFSKKTDKISVQRCSISERCADFAQHPVKTCRLIVPTGGGKTLSSLRFAIEYCKKYHKKKIFYIAPFMSILEQNSDEIKAIAGENFFTEHHSNLLAELKNDEEYHEYELRTEKWDAPVIATTMVQFLNTLFSFKNSAVRRMHRLADAVIIIDEVQSVPLKCVHLFNLAVNFLTHICGSTVVLCSATQPVMEQTKYPLLIDSESSMTGNVTEDFEIFHRTKLISEVTAYGYSYEEAADFCKEKFLKQGNLLVIVNTKSAAGNLFRLLKEILPEIPVIYLSTNLCPAHRNDKITEIKEFLRKKEAVICVTTQLIEAGVDISFRCVVRSVAGLDNAAQAAGRCNRNGESETPC
ncbi:MAG: CRISPR-associated helicase Cas3', partial [Oscillospiraceae bacterium]|nr:CRISPR-associated helicase Cas3' [Oscillospiraceae bacterium]